MLKSVLILCFKNLSFSVKYCQLCGFAQISDESQVYLITYHHPASLEM